MESVLAGFSLVRGMHDHVPGIIKVHQRLHIYLSVIIIHLKPNRNTFQLLQNSFFKENPY